MTNKNEKLLAIFLIFVCAYHALFGVMELVSPGEAFRFQQVADNGRNYNKQTQAWWSEIVPHWRIYQWFNLFYVLTIFGTLIWQGRKNEKI